MDTGAHGDPWVPPGNYKTLQGSLECTIGSISGIGGSMAVRSNGKPFWDLHQELVGPSTHFATYTAMNLLAPLVWAQIKVTGE